MQVQDVKMGTFWWVLFEFRDGPVMQWYREERLVFVGLDEQLEESDIDDGVFFTVESVEEFIRLDFVVDSAVPLSVRYQERTLSL